MSPSQMADLRETNRVFEEEVIAKRDFSELSRVYTKDARIMPPGAEMITGIEGIKAFWQAAVAALGATAVELRSVEVEFLGDTAVEIGRATITGGQGSGMEVKYVVVWKNEDAAWKWHIDIWNAVS